MDERDILGDRKPKANATGFAAARSIRAVIRLADAAEFSGRDARPLILDSDFQLDGIVLDAQTGAMSVLDGVVDQVLQCAAQG